MDEKKASLSTPAIIAIAVAALLIPCCVVLVIVAAIAIFTGATGIGPFIYPLF